MDLAGAWVDEPTPARPARRLQWATRGEHGIVAYDLFRGETDRGAGRRANEALIAASNCPAGARYSFQLPGAAGADGWVLRAWTDAGDPLDLPLDLGPAIPGAGPVVPPRTAPVSGLGGRVGARGAGIPPVPSVASVDVGTGVSGVFSLSGARLAESFGRPLPEVLDALRSGSLRLTQQGIGIPVLMDADEGRAYFFAPRLESLYFAGNVTQVRWGGVTPLPSRAVEAGLAAGRRQALGGRAFEKDLVAVPTLPGGAEEDFWVWDILLGGHPAFGTRAYAFDLPSQVPAPAGGAVVQVDVISTSTASHQFSVSLNGVVLGTNSWAGPRRRRLEFPADASVLRATNNVLGLVSSGDRTSFSYLDRFVVRHPRNLDVSGGPVEFQATDGSVLEASATGGSAVEVWDVTTPYQPVRLGTGAAPGAGGRLRFRPDPGNHYVAFARGGALEPDWVRGHGPERLTGARAGAEYLVVAPDAFAEDAARLASLRAAGGLSAQVVLLADIQHEFGHGMTVPAALASFLANAVALWSVPPRFAVLLGDGTYDYRGASGHSDNWIPPLVMATDYGRVVSDVLFGDVDRDGRPEVVLGRLPVHSREEFQRVYSQIVAYEAAPVPAPKALLVADRPEAAGDFVANAGELAGLLSGVLEVQSVLNRSLDVPGVRSGLLRGIASGMALFDYIGHGGRDRFGSGYLSIPDVATMDLGGVRPVVLAMTCAAGQFGLPGYPCLGEAMILKEGVAPVAVWSSTGFSVDAQAHQLALGLTRNLAGQPVGTRLGDTLRRTLATYVDAAGDPVSPALYNLLGDPGLSLGFGAPRPFLRIDPGAAGPTLTLTGIPGRRYLIGRSDAIGAGPWAPALDLTADASGVARATWTQAGVGPANFFRAVLIP